MEQNQKYALLRTWTSPSLEIIEEDSPPPFPQPGNVLIRVEASSVQSTDLFMRTGHYPQTYLKKKPPIILGYDFVGRIVALGDGVSEYNIGDRVCNLCMYGGHARYIEQNAEDLVSVPEGMESDEATTMVLSWVSAYQMLYRTKARRAVEAGEPIFVAGGAGAVGQVIIKLAVKANCKVYTTARPDHHAFLESIGAIPYDYTRRGWYDQLYKDVGPRGVSVSFDGVGDDLFHKSKSILKGRGVLVIYGAHSKAKNNQALQVGVWLLFDVILPLAFSFSRGYESYSVAKMRAYHPEYFKKDLGHLFQMVLNGEINGPSIQENIDLEEINEYHEKLRAGGFSGKIVCEPR